MTTKTIHSLASASLCAAAVLLTSAPALVMAARPAQAFAVAAVFPPWWSAGRVRAVVGPIGAIAAEGRLPTVVTVYGGGDLARSLSAAGAWLILDPTLAGCGRPPERTA